MVFKNHHIKPQEPTHPRIKRPCLEYVQLEATGDLNSSICSKLGFLTGRSSNLQEPTWPQGENHAYLTCYPGQGAWVLGFRSSVIKIINHNPRTMPAYYSAGCGFDAVYIYTFALMAGRIALCGPTGGVSAIPRNLWGLFAAPGKTSRIGHILAAGGGACRAGS